MKRKREEDIDQGFRNLKRILKKERKKEKTIYYFMKHIYTFCCNSVPLLALSSCFIVIIIITDLPEYIKCCTKYFLTLSCFT